MTSRVLIITGTTKQSSISVLDAFQILRRGELTVKAILVSYLSDLFKRSLGPTTLSYWMREEESSMERISDYFARMEIPYHSKIVVVPPWKMIFEEMDDGDHDMIIVDREFLKKWSNEKVNCSLCSEMFSQRRRPVLLINSDEDRSY